MRPAVTIGTSIGTAAAVSWRSTRTVARTAAAPLVRALLGAPPALAAGAWGAPEPGWVHFKLAIDPAGEARAGEADG